MGKYRVTLPVDIGGRIWNFGEVVELDIETAAAYAHALIALEDEDGRDS
jgi:hypothetical protein